MDVAGPICDIAWLGPSYDVFTATWKQAAYVASLPPQVGLLLAAQLEEAASSSPEQCELLREMAVEILATP